MCQSSACSAINGASSATQARVCAATWSRPTSWAGAPGGGVTQLDGDTGRGQVPVGQKGHDVMTSTGHIKEPVEDLLPVGLADDPHPQSLSEGDELLEEVVRLETLGNGEDGGELTAGPGADEVPVTHMRQRHDDAACAYVLVQLGVEIRAYPRKDLLRGDSGQGEGLVEVAHVGAHSRSRGPAQ